MGEIARFSDGFIGVLKRDFLKAEFDYPIRVLIFEDSDKFQEFLRHKLGVEDPPHFGIYLDSAKMFVTYEASGLGTFSHEILHPLVEKNLPAVPPWAFEGIPTFFEKFYGYWNGDELIVKWGYQNPWRIAQLGTNLTRLNLKTIVDDPNPYMNHSTPQHNESNVRMVSMFLWEQGKFKRFLRLIQNKDKGEYSSYFEAAMGMTLEKITPLWQDYLNRVAQQRQTLLKLPPSTILPDEAEFNRFAKRYGISTAQVKQQD